MTSSDRSATVPVVRSLPAPGEYLCGLGWDGRLLWHSDQAAGEIYALDPSDGRVERTLGCPRLRADLTCHEGLLWQVGGRPKRLLLIDPVSGADVGERPVVPASGRLCGVEAAPEGIWLGLRAPAVVQLRDTATLRVRRQFPVDGQPSGLTVHGDVVLYADFEESLIRAVDTATGELRAAVPVEGRPVGMTWGDDLLWYGDFAARRLKALRPDDVLAGWVVPRARREWN
jgi:hypothetical protein